MYFLIVSILVESCMSIHRKNHSWRMSCQWDALLDNIHWNSSLLSRHFWHLSEFKCG